MILEKDRDEKHIYIQVNPVSDQEKLAEFIKVNLKIIQLKTQALT